MDFVLHGWVLSPSLRTCGDGLFLKITPEHVLSIPETNIRAHPGAGLDEGVQLGLAQMVSLSSPVLG